MQQCRDEKKIDVPYNRRYHSGTTASNKTVQFMFDGYNDERAAYFLLSVFHIHKNFSRNCPSGTGGM